MSAITAGAIAGYIGDRSAELLIKGVTKYFGTLTKAKQKAFLNSIGRITNAQLRAIRQEAKRGLTPKILGDLVEKYGYNVVVSAWVSSSLTSLS